MTELISFKTVTRFSVPLTISGEKDIKWLGVKNKQLFVESIYEDTLSIYAHDILGGALQWTSSWPITDLYPSYDLEPAFYNNNILIPLDAQIEYINTEDGQAEGQYTDEDIEQIYSFNKYSIQGESMIFFIEDIEYEYVVVDLATNKVADQGKRNYHILYILLKLF